MQKTQFSWDENKNALNVRKHGITFEEASTSFTMILRLNLMILTIQLRKNAF